MKKNGKFISGTEEWYKDFGLSSIQKIKLCILTAELAGMSNDSAWYVSNLNKAAVVYFCDERSSR